LTEGVDVAITRRRFLENVGRTGGGAAVAGAMRSLGLSAEPRPAWRPLPGRAPAGTRVIVLGAGLAGLAAAYELQKLGYQCEVLDARMRTGGRCVSVRRGFVSEEAGMPAQKANFDPELYLNVGPMRIPHHHAPTLEYCRELGVAIEPFTAANDAAFVHNSTAPAGARRMRVRELRADWRGYTSELLAKAVASESLDRPLSSDDRERIVEWLRQEGGLSAEMRYAGSTRRGYKTAPGVGATPGVTTDPVAFADLTMTGFGRYLSSEFAMQSPMFQIVGGTDNLQKALAARVPHVTLGAEVKAIEQPAGGVRVRYKTAAGVTREIAGAFCISTIGLPLLRDVELDAGAELRAAVAAINYSSAAKIGLQFARRFWEEDDQIFGGITRTNLDITQIVYPSAGYLTRKGIVIGYYLNGQNASRMGELTPAERQRLALEQGAQIHPQYPSAFENAFSIAWQKVAYSRGGWAQFTEAQRKNEYLTLIKPDRQLYLAGDYTTYLSGWMAGALESARTVVRDIHERSLRSSTTVRAGER
jgi:monoamine oxidase